VRITLTIDTAWPKWPGLLLCRAGWHQWDEPCDVVISDGSYIHDHHVETQRWCVRCGMTHPTWPRNPQPNYYMALKARHEPHKNTPGVVPGADKGQIL
jgi:hypothetical protein